MEKRLVLFVVISVAIIFSYPFFITWVSGPIPETTSETLPENSIQTSGDAGSDRAGVHDVGASRGNTESTGINQEVGTAEEPEDPGLPVEATPLEVEKVIESDLYRVTLSSSGGVIKQWELKKYTEKKEESEVEEAIELVPEEMLHFPLTMISPEESIRGNRAYHLLDEAPLQLDANTPLGVVKMVYAGPDGKKITKELRFHHDTYEVDFKVETEGYDQAYDLSLGTNFGIHEWGLQRGGTVGGIGLIDDEVVRASPPKMKEDKTTFDGKAKWFGLQDKYFLSALVPNDDFPLGPVSFEKRGAKEISAKVQLEQHDGVHVHNFLMYVGPKEFDRLNKLDVNLDEAIDFGWFMFGSLLPVRMIAKPIFYLLKFFHQFTQNYGISIIIVTVLIKALFYPITKKSMSSMKSMSTIQPKIAAVKKQWAQDKEKMNQELMKLYRTEKVNPLGGCLPMLIQIPVFISLYNILYTTIELRHAPFFLWVQDLSQKDPYYVLPVIMGATMFLQQYTAPKTMDSSQSKVMQFLPIVYTYFFLNFPSGLVLYWLVNNSLTIVQQQILNKTG